MSLQLAEQHYAAQARQEEATSLLAAREWRRMGVDDLDGSWAKIVQRLTLLVASGQLGAARAGATYVGQMVDVDPLAELNPAAWSGIASDGRPLDSLLYSSVIHTKELIGAGQEPPQALAAGGDRLGMIARTQVADASRGAAGVAIAARPQVGYVRLASAPCCQRCAVLAGKRFKWNTGFQRHPRCDCRHVPTENGVIPDGYVGDIPAGQIRDLTRSQRKAIADGADTAQVINAHRAGRRSKDGMTTAEGSNVKGRRRLTPEGIYRVSSSREEAVQRLRDNGYLL